MIRKIKLMIRSIKSKLSEFNTTGYDGWELVQILPRNKEDKFHVDLAIWKEKNNSKYFYNHIIFLINFYYLKGIKV